MLLKNINIETLLSLSSYNNKLIGLKVYYYLLGGIVSKYSL